jgi:hypothetical protein
LNLKINGSKIKPLPDVIKVIPHGEERYVFKAASVLDFSEFEALCPEPEPPFEGRPGQKMIQNPLSPKHIKAIEEWRGRRLRWLFVKSLSATEGLEWEMVKLDDPETWGLWEEELEKSGLSQLEIGEISSAVIEANGLDQEKIKIATESFLREAVAQHQD